MPSREPVVPDLVGARAVVTGASSGVGLEIARVLAARGAHVVMPVRSRERGDRAREAIRATAPEARLELRDLDLASLDSARRLGRDLVAEGGRLDILVLNAGVARMGERDRVTTPDGFELHFQTNFLGHAALTLALLPALRSSATRVAVQCSLGTALHGVAWDDLQFERRYGVLRAYASSKTALGLFGVALATRVPETRVGLCHPGVVPATAIAPELRGRVWPGPRDFIVRRLWNPPARAAQPALLALAHGGAPPPFFAPGGPLQFSGAARRRRPFRRLVDPVGARRIWELAERLGGGADIAAR